MTIMRIISDFVDYYDCCQDYQDKTNKYLRKQTIVPNAWGADVEDGDTYTSELHLVGFCGEIYPCRTLTITSTYDGTVIHKKTYYDRKKYLADFDALIKRKDSKKCGKWWSRKSHHSSNKSLWQQISDGSWSHLATLKQEFRDYHVPVFVVTGQAYRRCNNRLILNACLKDYEFFRVKDPRTACQEIEMYLFGVLGSQEKEKIPPVSNEDLILAKGFDLKHSFRKEKSRR